MLKSYPLTMAGVPFRGHGVADIYEMGERIAFIHFAFAAPSEQDIAAKLTPVYVLLDTFSRDFGEHERRVLAYKDRKIFSAASALCYPQEDYFVLNTRYYEGFTDSIAKLIEIRGGEMTELKSAPPAPVKQIYNDARIYEFEGFAVRMSSPFMMECKESAGANLNGSGSVFSGEATLNLDRATSENFKNFAQGGEISCGDASDKGSRDEQSGEGILNGGEQTRKKSAAKTGKTLWRLKLGAYLYTPVYLRGGVLYFGTAGKGGHLYAVDAASGEAIFKFDTGGTERFAWRGDEILLSDRRGKPVLIGARDGSLAREIEFGEFQFGSDQIMLASGGRLYAVAHDGIAMHAVCADL